MLGKNIFIMYFIRNESGESNKMSIRIPLSGKNV